MTIIILRYKFYVEIDPFNNLVQLLKFTFILFWQIQGQWMWLYCLLRNNIRVRLLENGTDKRQCLCYANKALYWYWESLQATSCFSLTQWKSPGCYPLFFPTAHFNTFHIYLLSTDDSVGWEEKETLILSLMPLIKRKHWNTPSYN